jgi:hypothetical protein
MYLQFLTKNDGNMSSPDVWFYGACSKHKTVTVLNITGSKKNEYLQVFTSSSHIWGFGGKGRFLTLSLTHTNIYF